MYGCTTLAVLLAASITGAAIAPAAWSQNRPAEAAPAQQINTADDLLAALERADENLLSLTADIRYDRTFALQGDRQVRTGKLYFVSGKPGEGAAADSGTRKFAVTFDRLRTGDTVRDEPKAYIFDGEWLIERLPAERPPVFIKRQVVPPGQKFDPLRIGEGPFPIPIGQRAADITERFDVELVPAAAGLDAPEEAHALDRQDAAALQQFVAGDFQLRLTPRPEVADQENFSEIRLWYRLDPSGRFLPRMARTVDQSESVSIVQLINVAVQRAGEPPNPSAAVPTDVLDTTPPPPTAGWDVQIKPWQKAIGSAPARERPDAGEP